MRPLRQFTIEIYGLANGTHNFRFEFDDTFFSSYEDSLVSKGKGMCVVDLTKTDSMLTLEFEVEGMIELECDRSLELFDHPISLKKEVIYKYGIEEKELSENVFVILKDHQEIDVADFLYEFITLEVPMKKLHPKFKDEDNNDELIYTSIKKNEDKGTDPRWDALKRLTN